MRNNPKKYRTTFTCGFILLHKPNSKVIIIYFIGHPCFVSIIIWKWFIFFVRKVSLGFYGQLKSCTVSYSIQPLNFLLLYLTIHFIFGPNIYFTLQVALTCRITFILGRSIFMSDDNQNISAYLMTEGFIYGLYIKLGHPCKTD